MKEFTTLAEAISYLKKTRTQKQDDSFQSVMLDSIEFMNEAARLMPDDYFSPINKNASMR